MNILFFDVVPTNIVRFFYGIVSELRNKEKHNFHFLIEEDDANTLEHVKENYPFYSKANYVKERNVDWFVDYLKRNNIEAVFINAQRIPDDMMVFAAKELDIPTFMFQHGMYIEFLKRNLGFFLSKIWKTIRFFIYALNLGKKLPGNSVYLIFKYIKCFVFGGNQVRVGLPRKLLNADRVYVYGEFWKEFHKKQFDYSLEQQVIVGYPELQDVKSIKLTNEINNSVCYIAQTLVEDGRLNRSTQLDFYQKLVDLCSQENKKLFVKLHPRSDSTLYEYRNNESVTLITSDFPFCGKYIGHYSTLITKGVLLSGDLFIWEYDNHPTPFYFSEMATKTSRITDELQSWLNTESNEGVDTKGYFDYNPNVYGTIVSDFYNIMNHK